MCRSWMSLLLLVLSGCSVLQVREEARAFYGATVLVGRVAGPPGWSGPIVVAATTLRNGERSVAHAVLLHEPGGYELIVPDGEYTLLAYGDRDGNGRPDAGDPTGMLLSPVRVAGAGLVTLLDIELRSDGVDTVHARLPPDGFERPVHSTQAGAVIDFDADAFSAASGGTGYWAPMDSFRRTGGNVYFAEPYDPGRTPVLFVHGAAGSAQDFRYFVQHLDRSRYQAWLFQYPSGAALDSMAHLLYWKLLNLKFRYGFHRLDIVAHSMGGLVARRFLLDHGEQFPEIAQFISISTPWHGEPAATLGVKHSPGVIPSWRDMQPEGAFMRALFARTLPAHVPHALLFGHRGGYNLLRPTTDGTVTLASQLRSEAQAEAQLVIGFDEDHVSILNAAPVLKHVSRLLDAADRTGGVASGSVELSLSFADPDSRLGGMPALMLTQAGNDTHDAAPMLLVIRDDAKRAFDRIPPGTYAASVVAPAFRSSPATTTIEVRGDRATRVAFALVPQGTLTGRIVGASDPIDAPAGSFRGSGGAPTISRIILEGPGGRRDVVPRSDGDPGVVNAYLDGRDDAKDGEFSFVGLARGEYTLTIEAQGYAPHVSHHRIEPGVVAPMTLIVLRPPSDAFATAGVHPRPDGLRRSRD